MMLYSKRYIASLCFALCLSSGLSVAPHALMAESRTHSTNDIISYVDPDKIAVDPILLKT